MTNGHYICIVKRKINREDILKTGQELMFLNGYNATGIKEITDGVNIPKGSFYNHFSSKEEFGLEVLQGYCDNGARLYERTLLDSNVSPLQRFDNFFTNIIDNYKNVAKCKLGCIMGNFSLELADTNERFRVILNAEFDRLESIIVQCLNDAQRQNEISGEIDTDMMGGFILNSWHGALVRMKSTASISPLTDFKTLIFGQILN